MSDAEIDDFLDSDTYAAPAPSSATAGGATRQWRVPAAAAAAGWLVAGVVAGGVAVAAWHSHSSTPTAAGVPTGGTGNANGIPGGFTAGPGGAAGEQHLTGTLSAVNGRSFAVTTTTGTTTYTIDATTTLVKDGQRVASLAALSEGDTVVVHVYPLNGTTHVELVLDGAPGGGFSGPGGPPMDTAPDSTGTTTST